MMHAFAIRSVTMLVKQRHSCYDWRWLIWPFLGLMLLNKLVSQTENSPETFKGKEDCDRICCGNRPYRTPEAVAGSILKGRLQVPEDNVNHGKPTCWGVSLGPASSVWFVCISSILFHFFFITDNEILLCHWEIITFLLPNSLLMF